MVAYYLFPRPQEVRQVLQIEKPAPNGNILTGEDAVWWSIVTIATVAYGDRYPTTPEGRLIGPLMIIVGVSLFSVLTSFIATTFVARRRGTAQATTSPGCVRSGRRLRSGPPGWPRSCGSW
jgi:hypothetical protein